MSSEVEPVDVPIVSGGDPLEPIAAFARAVGARGIAADAERLSRQLDHSRLFVAVIGASARQRAEVVNALLDGPVLPVHHDLMQIPISIRHGSAPAARVRFADDGTSEIDLAAVPHFILPAMNPGNARRVRLIELCWDHALTRFGACIVEGVGGDLTSLAQEVPRVDFVLQADSGESVPRSWAVDVLMARRCDSDDVESTLAASGAVARASIETGAARIEQLRYEEAHRLCLRLEQRFLEEQRAVVREATESRRWIAAVASCVSTVSPRSIAAPIREGLSRWLDAERRKLVMGSTADLRAAFRSRFALERCPKSWLHTTAAEIARDLAVATIRRWRSDLRSHVDRHIGAMAEALLVHAIAESEPFDTRIRQYAFDGVSVMTSYEPFTFETELDGARDLWSRCAELLMPEGWTRARVENRIGERLIAGLDMESRRTVEAFLRYFDRSRAMIQARYGAVLEELHEHAAGAYARAKTLHTSGFEAIADEQRRIEARLARLAQIRALIPVMAE